MGGFGGGGGGEATTQRTPTSVDTPSSQFARDIASELFGVPGNLNIDDRFQADQFIDPATGRQLDNPVAALAAQLGIPLDEFGANVGAFSSAGQGLAGRVESGLIPSDQLSAFMSGLLDFGEGGILPRTISEAFAPFEARGRQNIISEGTRRGLLTTSGGRSTDVDRAFGEFQASLAGQKAQALPGLLSAFLNVSRNQGDIANLALNMRGSALPFQQSLAGARSQAILEPFSLQERQFARDLERLRLGIGALGTPAAGGFTQVQTGGGGGGGIFPPILAGSLLGGGLGASGQAVPGFGPTGQSGFQGAGTGALQGAGLGLLFGG
jgi:hypothetical protein